MGACLVCLNMDHTMRIHVCTTVPRKYHAPDHSSSFDSPECKLSFCLGYDRISVHIELSKNECNIWPDKSNDKIVGIYVWGLVYSAAHFLQIGTSMQKTMTYTVLGKYYIKTGIHVKNGIFQLTSASRRAALETSIRQTLAPFRIFYKCAW